MSRSVVLVEHDRRTALALEETLIAAGSRVIARSTHLDDALRKVVALRPDVAIVDAAIPDGLALAHAIQQSTQTAIVMVVDGEDMTARERTDPWCVAIDATAAELAVTIELACRDLLPRPTDTARHPPMRVTPRGEPSRASFDAGDDTV